MVTSCQTVQTTRGGVVGVDRPQQMSVFTPSAAEVAATARQQYLQVMQGAAHKGALNRDPTQTARVQRMAQRLIPHTAVFRDDAVRWPWQVNVLTSPEVNAWCMPGGKMAVYTGLLQQLAVTDDELAAVLGHESRMRCANTCARGWDGSRRPPLGRPSVRPCWSTYGGEPWRVGHTFTQAMSCCPTVESTSRRPTASASNSPRARLRPRAAVALWQKMAARGGGAAAVALDASAHATRIRDLQDYTKRVLPLYAQAEK